jgi:hypothetical protein
MNFEHGDVVPHHEDDKHTYTYLSPIGEPMVSITFSRIDDQGEGKLFAEWEVTWLLGQPDADPIIEFDRANLHNQGKGVGGWGKFPERLEQKGYDADWDTMIQGAISQTIQYHRSRAASGVGLGWTEADDANNPYLIKPFLSSSGVTVLYGAEGSNKSMMALSLGLSVATGVPTWGATPTNVAPIIYVDFEDDHDVHNLRITAEARALGLERDDIAGKVYHVRITGAFRDAQQDLRDMVRQDGAGLVVVDSVGLARAGDVSASDVTIKLFKALRFLNVPVLALDHVTKAERKGTASRGFKPDLATPIGSQFTMSSARLAWFIEKMPTSTERVRRYNLHNTKHNHIPKQASRGLTVTIESDKNDNPIHTRFEVWDSMFLAVKAEESGAVMLLMAFAANEYNPMTVTELAKRIGRAKSTVHEAMQGNEWFVKGEKFGREQFYMLTEKGLRSGRTMAGEVESG